ncbi:hypothetical protein FOZG_14601 [Fusarium oxysporum Fo47]|uniref:Enoyl reductase (ER) domain-containing protein n=1 Tax=Fusarium oxysporum Fo47 TaxID=660027 RepID=W9JQ33_FUSOX|nr:hypothetical protein FOZG_14601 [Fusarium oxysporum Fo47]
MEVFFRTSGFGPLKEFPAMLGSECSGTVLAVGEGIKGFCTGDHVATILSFTSVPGFATEMKGHERAVYGEQAYVPADMVVKMPNDMSFSDGAALWVQYSTAWNAMLDTAKLQKGEYVLLTAATSSVAIAAAQIAQSQGAIPISTEVARISDGIGVIYDPIAGENINKLLDAFANNGILLIYGVLGLSPALIDPLKGMAKFATIKLSAVFQTLSNPKKRAKMVNFVQRGIAEGVLRPVIDLTLRSHGLDDIPFPLDY